MGRHETSRRLSRAGRWGFTALLGLTLLVLALLVAMCGGVLQPRGGDVDTRREVAVGWGFTHTQYSADHGDADARKAAGRLLSAGPLSQNQHIMGWGVDNPEPKPGAYNFADLDRRVALMRRTAGTPVLTLCCAPDWMKGGGQRTDWSQKSLETAPDRKYYKDFAKLAGVVAKRYPDVRHFIVWNELKGFFDESKNRWDYEGYTELYNLVHAELKKQNRNNLVGGPYVVMDSEAPGSKANASSLRGPWGVVDQRSVDAVTYWNKHKVGADFVVVDGSSYTRESDQFHPDEFGATTKFADVTTWLRKTTGLPVWWAEWYVEPADGNDDRRGWTEQHRLAVQATAMMQLAGSGASAAFYWNPQEQSADCPGCLWRSTELADGGKELPMMKLLTRFAKEFPPGTDFREVDIDDDARVRALATDTSLLVVNTQNRAVSTRVDGSRVDLKAYEVRWIS
ncbi:xylan 1,4-beta-xylosidase [Streptomyces sp. QH1-20]|uniref:xylan 1,4-beta-xylosidase n=1 Tax=Streptomyces sp. QH1-20 TaxID=3240934 RepID=UPI00351231F7